MGPSNESCKDVLLNSDRLMLINLLNNSIEDIWTLSNCDRKNPVVAHIPFLHYCVGPIGWPISFVLKRVLVFLPGRFTVEK